MILYSIISYLIMVGILLDQHDNFETLSWKDLKWFVFSPIVVPILIGLHINQHYEQE